MTTTALVCCPRTRAGLRAARHAGETINTKNACKLAKPARSKVNTPFALAPRSSRSAAQLPKTRRCLTRCCHDGWTDNLICALHGTLPLSAPASTVLPCPALPSVRQILDIDDPLPCPPFGRKSPQHTPHHSHATPHRSLSAAPAFRCRTLQFVCSVIAGRHATSNDNDNDNAVSRPSDGDRRLGRWATSGRSAAFAHTH
ncbi:hypothetical protein B0T25DRAFT_22447 [Lasiosphaeria hispida]|uniref:Uncharacterized protein n=1 Tax=Lasiosphaeria hispida TaxID=260671 RepID=A0AAJ0MJL0_9PEZI|nr:hypothetical protein B0T25DRAFT_22447 [Lasiosphaeria hispida]